MVAGRHIAPYTVISFCCGDRRVKLEHNLLRKSVAQSHPVYLVHFDYLLESCRLRWLNTVLAVCEYMSLLNHGNRKVAAHKLKLGK